MELPFELLGKDHKTTTKWNWKNYGMIFDNEEHFETIYQAYIYATHCDRCRKPFKSTKDRQLDHNHETGEVRDIICRSCNYLRKDKLKSNNTSGYTNIFKAFYKSVKQGFIWRFRVNINGKVKTIKSSIDKDKLIEFAEKWYEENDYFT